MWQNRTIFHFCICVWLQNYAEVLFLPGFTVNQHAFSHCMPSTLLKGPFSPGKDKEVKVFKNEPSKTNLGRLYHYKVFKSCLRHILRCPDLNTLTHINQKKFSNSTLLRNQIILPKQNKCVHRLLHSQ